MSKLDCESFRHSSEQQLTKRLLTAEINLVVPLDELDPKEFMSGHVVRVDLQLPYGFRAP